MYNSKMSKQLIHKLEHDLGHFIIGELTKKQPSKKGSPEMYKYKGLGITPYKANKGNDQTLAIRIGSLEASFKVNTAEKCYGFLNPEEEHLVKIWLGQTDVYSQVKTLFKKQVRKKNIAIIPFDLEEFYT